MFHGHLLRGEALDKACEGEDIDELLDWRKGRYAEFTRTHLKQRVGPGTSTSQAPARAASLVLGLVAWRDHGSIPVLYLVERGPLLALIGILAVPPALAPRHC